MIIRPAAAPDLPAIVALADAAETAAHWTPAHFDRIFSAPGRVALVAESPPGAIAGFLIASNLAPDWEIENVVVAPSARRRGLGASLVAAVVARARAAGAGRIHLEVRASNTAALRLYASAGFRQTGRRTGYYSAPAEDALQLTLGLA
jgi:ribosomal-protein-alanine N-acetyltransferase